MVMSEKVDVAVAAFILFVRAVFEFVGLFLLALFLTQPAEFWPMWTFVRASEGGSRVED